MSTSDSPSCTGRKLDLAIKAAWIEDLESGASQQYQGGWGFSRGPQRCCLNVLDAVTLPRLGHETHTISVWALIPNQHHIPLIWANDNGPPDNYARVIAYIRKNL